MSMRDRTNWSAVKNILCVRLDALGDVLMTTPAIRALKESHPGRRITLLTSPGGAEAAALVPEIDEVVIYDAPWVKSTSPRGSSSPEYRMIERLRRARFDAAVIFTVYSQNPLPAAMQCYLADIPLRLAHCRENPYQLLTDRIAESEPEEGIRHEVRRQLDLVASVGSRTRNQRMSLCIPLHAPDRVLGRLREAGVDLARPWVAVHPGASAPSRRYPAEGFAEAARTLALVDGLQIVFTGGPSEEALIEEVQREMSVPSFTLAGKLDLGELAAFLARAPLLIANNSGPAHVAAAVGTPVVDLYALTNPQHTPWMVPSRVLNHDVPCRNCYKSVCPEGHHNCLRLVPPEAVVGAARELLAATIHDVDPEVAIQQRRAAPWSQRRPGVGAKATDVPERERTSERSELRTLRNDVRRRSDSSTPTRHSV